MDTFEFQPTLSGDLVALRPLRVDDFDALFAAGSDPLIWEQHPSSDRYKPDVFRRYFGEGIASGGALIATNRESGEVIGSSRYHGYDAEESEVEIGWTFLARKYWGGRYNGEMKRLMMKHAFKLVNRVLFLIGEENWRSRRAVEKLGAVLSGTRIDERGVEQVVYGITKDMLKDARDASRG